MKRMKKMGILLVTVLMLLGADSTVFATVVYNGPITMFGKQYVDSNEWTYVCDSSRTTTSTSLEVQITNIYKADGSDSNYKKVKVFCAAGSLVVGSDTVSLNDPKSYIVPSGYNAAGTINKMFAMGNDPSLDCQISGFFTTH